MKDTFNFSHACCLYYYLMFGKSIFAICFIFVGSGVVIFISTWICSGLWIFSREAEGNRGYNINYFEKNIGNFIYSYCFIFTWTRTNQFHFKAIFAKMLIQNKYCLARLFNITLLIWCSYAVQFYFICHILVFALWYRKRLMKNFMQESVELQFPVKCPHRVMS